LVRGGGYLAFAGAGEALILGFRRRCLASNEAWQISDGMLAEAAVINKLNLWVGYAIFANFSD